MTSVPYLVKREDDKRIPVIKSKCANVVVHSCIGSNSSEGLESDNGEIVSFIHSESIDDRAGMIMEVFVRLVSYKQRGCMACKLNEMEKKNRNRAFSGGV